ncbi:MAG: hypothetical protein NVS3B3_01440 [Aquirhabdus sp.]
MSRLLIVGAGGHGRSLAEAVLAGGIYEIAGFIDDSAQKSQLILGYPVLGNTSNLITYRSHASLAIVALGNNILRETLSNTLLSLGFKLITVIHPRAIVASSAVIGDGSAIMAGAIIGTEARLGCGVIVNCGAVVDHDAQVHDYGHLGVNACMSGGSVLGRQAWLQAGSSLGFGVQIAGGFVLQAGEGLSNE